MEFRIERMRKVIEPLVAYTIVLTIVVEILYLSNRLMPHN